MNPTGQSFFRPSDHRRLTANLFVALTLSSFLLFILLTPAHAQGTTAAAASGSDGFVQIINQVGSQGLSLFRAVLFVFLMIYAVLLGIAVSLGQAGTQEISSFILGTIFAAGAQLIASLYLAILT